MGGRHSFASQYHNHHSKADDFQHTVRPRHSAHCPHHLEIFEKKAAANTANSVTESTSVITKNNSAKASKHWKLSKIGKANSASVDRSCGCCTCCCCTVMTRHHQQKASTSSLHSLPHSSSSSRAAALCCVGAQTQLVNFGLVRAIGQGAFGKVYIVYNRPLHTHYALKCMSKRRLVQKSMATNVLRELEMLEELNHIFIVNLWFTFQDDDYIYMISDLLTGGDLRVHLNDQGRFCESRAKLYACEIALALDYLHRRQITHRDLKPENVLLDEFGHAHLTDLNLAVRLSDAHDGLATTFTGTRLYMAPEILLTSLSQITGYDHRVDWWSLGVCLFEMLHGRRPFEFPASFSSNQVLQLITGNLGLPAHWTSDLRSFISTLLSVEPNSRIDSLDKFRTHQYMERINMRHVLQRRTAPVFVPDPNQIYGSDGGRTSREEVEPDERRRLDSSPLNLRLQRRKSIAQLSSRVRAHTARSQKIPIQKHSDLPDIEIEQNNEDGTDNDIGATRARQHNTAIALEAPISAGARRISAPWSAELAHIALSFSEFNRFTRPPEDAAAADQQLNDTQLEQLLQQPNRPLHFPKRSQSGLLLTQNIPSTTTDAQQRNHRLTPREYQQQQQYQYQMRFRLNQKQMRPGHSYGMAPRRRAPMLNAVPARAKSVQNQILKNDTEASMTSVTLKFRPPANCDSSTAGYYSVKNHYRASFTKKINSASAENASTSNEDSTSMIITTRQNEDMVPDAKRPLTDSGKSMQTSSTSQSFTVLEDISVKDNVVELVDENTLYDTINATTGNSTEKMVNKEKVENDATKFDVNNSLIQRKRLAFYESREFSI